MSLDTYKEWRALWESLDDAQRESVKLKAQWEHMSLWAVCREWPGVWNDAQRLAHIRGNS